jgi:hypothetical protein
MWSEQNFVRCSLIPDDGGSMHLWNVGRQLFYTAVHPRRQFWTSYSPPWEVEISEFCAFVNLCTSLLFSVKTAWYVSLWSENKQNHSFSLRHSYEEFSLVKAWNGKLLDKERKKQICIAFMALLLVLFYPLKYMWEHARNSWQQFIFDHRHGSVKTLYGNTNYKALVRCQVFQTRTNGWWWRHAAE